MISQETVWEKIWPTVEQLIEATLAEDEEAIARLLVPGEQAARIHDLFGPTVFDILLKTVLGRGRVAVTRAIETENGRFVHIEFVWPDPDAEGGAYTAADLVSVQLRRYKDRWRVVAINPAAIELPLTEARAQGVLLTSGIFNEEGKAPQEPWILPVALIGGNLQLPLRQEALADEVEALLLPGLQHRTYGLLSLVAGRRLWRDFKQAADIELSQPPAWAAAAEFIMNEQTLREMTQAAVGKHYGVSLTAMLPRIRQIKQTLHIDGLDERYSALASSRIVLKDQKS